MRTDSDKSCQEKPHVQSRLQHQTHIASEQPCQLAIECCMFSSLMIKIQNEKRMTVSFKLVASRDSSMLALEV